jgi:hypothetical protein
MKVKNEIRKEIGEVSKDLENELEAGINYGLNLLNRKFEKIILQIVEAGNEGMATVRDLRRRVEKIETEQQNPEFYLLRWTS